MNFDFTACGECPSPMGCHDANYCRNKGTVDMSESNKRPNEQARKDVSVLRARAIAAALKDARPKDYLTNNEARNAWYDCCRYVAAVVCSADGVSILSFYDLCGVPY
jgi:hypothetical protein